MITLVPVLLQLFIVALCGGEHRINFQSTSHVYNDCNHFPTRINGKSLRCWKCTPLIAIYHKIEEYTISAFRFESFQLKIIESTVRVPLTCLRLVGVRALKIYLWIERGFCCICIRIDDDIPPTEYFTIIIDNDTITQYIFLIYCQLIF